MATEFEEMAKAFSEGARASSPTLPLTVLVVQVRNRLYSPMLSLNPSIVQYIFLAT